MPRWTRRQSWLAGLVFAGATGVIGCDGAPPSPARHDDRLWRPWAWTPARPPYGVHVRREYALLDLPWAGNAGHAGGAAGGRMVTVDLEADRSVSFKGRRWSLKPELRADSLESLGRDVRSLTQRRSEHGFSALLRCDYRASWGDVRGVITAVSDPPPVNVNAILFAVGPRVETSWIDAEISAIRVGARSKRAEAVKIALDVASASERSIAAPRLRMGERTLTFASGDPYADGPANTLANANWHVLLDDLRAATSKGVKGVDLTVADGVPWAHVAMVFGLVCEAKVTDVFVGEDSYQLFTGDPSLLGRDRENPELRDWSPTYARSLGVAGALAVFLLGAGRRERRRRTV